MERKHGRVCAGHITHMENRVLHVAKFNPIDTKVPRLLLDINSCPGGKRLLEYVKLYIYMLSF